MSLYQELSVVLKGQREDMAYNMLMTDATHVEEAINQYMYDPYSDDSANMRKVFMLLRQALQALNQYKTKLTRAREYGYPITYDSTESLDPHDPLKVVANTLFIVEWMEQQSTTVSDVDRYLASARRALYSAWEEAFGGGPSTMLSVLR